MNEYTTEFYQLNARFNLSEIEDQLIAHYIGGLKLVIQDWLALQGVRTMTHAVNLAIVKRKREKGESLIIVIEKL